MIIVSQSKLLILNFNNLLGLGVKSSSDNKSIEIKAYEFGTKDIEGITLGRYETLERAKEILKEITQYYKKFEYYGKITIGQRYDDTRENELGVYEMPES